MGEVFLKLYVEGWDSNLPGNNYESAKEKGFNINWFQDEFQPSKTEMLLKIRLNVNTKFGFVLSKENLSFWAFI